ncbi:hypothetical protein Poli38472_012300 [Pythium oligandrum]|uniref:Ankyrin n=1 Tax=Pythium oligandrum TaxID=41045 RepID=A0A8K1FNC7_PYTOL|nr:hypothetical protein Poli38472_012300 [Pythium oligandrum]|eukprot:TMW67184.1 hypothetical protein Poli38472_012300 [Pythium oligandrum]
MEEATLALFQVAAEGDLAGVQRFFTLETTARIIAQTNAGHRARSDAALARNESPFRDGMSREGWNAPQGSPSRSFFDVVISNDHRHILNWFLSSDACRVIGDTMRAIISSIATTVILDRPRDSFEVLEIIFDSYLFVKVLTPMERKHAFYDMSHVACFLNLPDLLRLLLAHGSDANIADARGSLLEVCGVFGSVECLEVLVESGIFGVQHAITTDWNAPFRNVEVALALLQIGVDMQCDPNRGSPLHVATRFRCDDVVETLATLGYVDVNARYSTTSTRTHQGGTFVYTIEDMTPLMIACLPSEYQRPGFATASVLVAHGADVRQWNRDGETALHILVKNKFDADIVALLVATDPEVINLPDQEGNTPLHLMLQTMELDFAAQSCDVLLSNGADPYICNVRGESAYQVLMESEQGREYVHSHPQYFTKPSSAT